VVTVVVVVVAFAFAVVAAAVVVVAVVVVVVVAVVAVVGNQSTDILLKDRIYYLGPDQDCLARFGIHWKVHERGVVDSYNKTVAGAVVAEVALALAAVVVVRDDTEEEDQYQQRNLLLYFGPAGPAAIPALVALGQPTAVPTVVWV